MAKRILNLLLRSSFPSPKKTSSPPWPAARDGCWPLRPSASPSPCFPTSPTPSLPPPWAQICCCSICLTSGIPTSWPCPRRRRRTRCAGSRRSPAASSASIWSLWTTPWPLTTPIPSGMSRGRYATVENAVRAADMGVDLIVLTGNPGNGVRNEAIVKSSRPSPRPWATELPWLPERCTPPAW